MNITSIYFGQTLATTASEYTVRILIGSILAIALVLLFASPLHHRYHFTKKGFFGILTAITLTTTIAFVLIHSLAMSGSEAGSVERRQARIALSVCDQQIPILSEDLLSSSAGSARQKIFDDGTLEYLGYVTDPVKDVSLGAFFQAFGGGISSSVMTLPYSEKLESRLTDSTTLAQFIRTNPLGQRYLELQSGSACSIYPSMISVFTYQYSPEKNMFIQTRLTQPEYFVLSKEPKDTMDCIVVIFGDPSSTTNLRCGDYPDADRIEKGTQEEVAL